MECTRTVHCKSCATKLQLADIARPVYTSFLMQALNGICASTYICYAAL